MSDRQGIEIDYCPKCRGIWLDRGELEKLIEKATLSKDDSSRRTSRHDSDYDDDDRRDDRRDDSSKHGRYKKRESWLSDIFDFG